MDAAVRGAIGPKGGREKKRRFCKAISGIRGIPGKGTVKNDSRACESLCFQTSTKEN